jgi:class 3 adenylate cyclase
MIDRPGRPEPRFPASAEALVFGRIARELDQLNACWGSASAAAGGDILFHEAMHERGAPTAVVLPCPEGEFVDACIAGMPGSDWKRRFDSVLQRAQSVEVLGQQCAADNAMASECCSRVVLGLATIQAQSLGVESLLVALWNERPGDRFGGTHSIVEFARAHARAVRVISMAAAVRRDAESSYDLQPIPSGASSAPSTSRPDQASPQYICAIVFSDAVGFSKLKEQQLPAFAKHYLGGIMNLLNQREAAPLCRNTWGDGLYLVFGGVREAGEFALDLCNFVSSKSWTDVGLPAEFNVRIAVHAGPVYQVYDPIQGHWSYIGSQVTQAARIEPTTPVGKVYVSRTFAALAAAELIQEFVFDDVGVIELAKGHGRMAAYCLRRQSERRSDGVAR